MNGDLLQERIVLFTLQTVGGVLFVFRRDVTGHSRNSALFLFGAFENDLNPVAFLCHLKDMIGFGGSPRASINLALAARTYAFIKRRGYVIPEDVRAVAHDVLRHRIGLTYEAEASNVTSDEIVSKILNKVEVP